VERVVIAWIFRLTGAQSAIQQGLIMASMVAFALACSAAGVMAWKYHSTRADLANAQAQLAQAAADLRTETQNVTALRAQLAQQNAAVQKLAGEAQKAEKRAAEAARKLLAARKPPPGFKTSSEFNLWLHTRMGGG
jgi:septal ring factor EnvC (AmiA/AmiB activator)